jgi:uncharacterized protein YhbP (UPF0306 family)
MDPKKLIKEYLSQHRVMQLATSLNNQPWVCNVHYFSDDDYAIYWISTPERRHSKEINENPNVAITIKVHEDTEDDPWVVGLSAEGTARQLTTDETKAIGTQYLEKVSKAPSLLEDILSGKNPHRFYKMTVTKFVLFDTNNFPDNPRQEIKI